MVDAMSNPATKDTVACSINGMRAAKINEPRLDDEPDEGPAIATMIGRARTAQTYVRMTA